METVVVEGKEYVVVHISESSFKRGYSVCTGAKFDIPSDNETRPKRLCEMCRIKIRDQRGI